LVPTRARCANARVVPSGHLADWQSRGDDGVIEPPIEHRDVTTIVEMLADIRDHVSAIHRLMEDENGEEEADETDA
jgi:hypothetical protein